MKYYVQLGACDSVGTELTAEEIHAHYIGGNVRLVHSYDGDGGIDTVLCVTDEDWDTRDTASAMYEASWTALPSSYEQCLAVAGY